MRDNLSSNVIRKYPPLPKTGDLSVSVPYGQNHNIRHLTPNLNREEFSAWVFEPEHPVTDEMTVYGYGLGECDATVENEAPELATLGLPVTLHRSSRKQPWPSPSALLFAPRVRGRFIRPAQNPLIRPSQAISRTMDSVQEHSRRYRRFTAKCHSMGGLTGIMLACHDERARDVTVIVVSHELDRFFSERDMEKAAGTTERQRRSLNG